MQLDERPGFWSYFFTSTLTIWVGLFAACVGFVVPQFAALFKDFGVDLPSITAFVVGKIQFIWPSLFLFFLVQLGLYIYFLVSKTYSVRRKVVQASYVNIIIQVIIISALYIPIFRLGSVV